MSIFLIAEAGVNHGGKISEAMKLADAAKDAGADAVKYQFFSSQKLWGDDRIKHLELSGSDMKRLHEHCERIGIEFMCSPFGVEELKFLLPMLKRIKIASGCIHNFDLTSESYESGLPIIMSTGMSDEADVLRAIRNRPYPLTLLHCTSSYPCRLEDVNLKAMQALTKFGFPVGYSDHTNGITASIAAAALGACMIEKHLTLDRNLPGPDHKASITPREMKALQIALIEVVAMLGDGQKRVLPCEEPLRKLWRAA